MIDPSPRCLMYHGSREGRPIHDLDAISEVIEDADALVWYDVIAPKAEDLATIQREFDLHPLAIEDAVRAHERSKIETYRDYLFIVTHGVTLDGDVVSVHEIALFVGHRFVVSVRAAPAYSFAEVRERWHAGRHDDRNDGASLLYSILDTIVDDYDPIVADFERRIDKLETRFFREGRIASRDLLETSAMKRNLGRFRRAVLPMREIVAFPLRGEQHFFRPDDFAYFRDVHDHVLLAIDRIESTRALIDNVLDTHLSIQTNRQNEVAKQLTIIATIFLPLTFVTGFFGQNFAFMVDAIKTEASFWYLGIGTEVVAVVALVVFFRARGWF